MPLALLASVDRFTVSERSKTRFAPLATVTAPVPNLPVVPPSPTWSVPALMVVVPMLVLLPAYMSVPLPFLITGAEMPSAPVIFS